MTATRKLTLSDMPGWPERLSREEAAAVMGVSANHFDKYNRPFLREIREGSRVLFLYEEAKALSAKTAETSNKLAALNGL